MEPTAPSSDKANPVEQSDRREFLVRAGTWDSVILELVLGGEYGNLDFTGKTVVDIGAHIGAFSVLAALRGARRVLAFEAWAENHALLVVNCEPFPVVECHHGAVWRSDAGAGVLRWKGAANPENTGGGSVLDCAAICGWALAATDSQEVNRIAFDEIIREAGTVDLLKIDAEGSEYPILLTSRTLHRVREIVGEYHVVSGVAETQAIAEYPEWNIGSLRRHLAAHGFVVEVRDKGALGLFRAFRKTDAGSPSASA
jgi:FkbM family methyltransferase